MISLKVREERDDRIHFFYKIDIVLLDKSGGDRVIGPFKHATTKIGFNVRFRKATYFAYLVPGKPERHAGITFSALLLVSPTAPMFTMGDHFELYDGNDVFATVTVLSLIEGNWRQYVVEQCALKEK